MMQHSISIMTLKIYCYDAMVVKALLMLTILNGHIFLVTLPLSKHRDAGDLRRHRTHFDVNVM